MRNTRWNPAIRHTVCGEPGNEEWLRQLASARRMPWGSKNPLVEKGPLTNIIEMNERQEVRK